MAFTVQISKADLAKITAIEKSANKRTFYRRLTVAYEREAVDVASRSSRNYLSGQRLQRRTGRLAGSIVGRGGLFGGIPGLRVGVLSGPALDYAGPQEYGTKGKNSESPYPTIKPRTAKALAMPVGEALTPAGVDRYGGPRGFPGELRYVGAKKGNVVGVLVNADDDSERPDALYILLSEVELEPQFYLRDAMLSSLGEIADITSRVLADVVSGNTTKI